MNCCDYDCDQGRDCPARAKRRVRAGQPAPDLPIQYAEPDDMELDASDWWIVGGAIVLVFTTGVIFAKVFL